MKFLIVEDEPAGATILKMILAEFGQVEWVGDGTKALQAFQRAWETGQPYDIIFMDIMMPECNGQDVLALIRKSESERGQTRVNEVKVVMTTVLDDMDNVKKAFYEGRASAYLVKPIMRENVLEELKKLGVG